MMLLKLFSQSNNLQSNGKQRSYNATLQRLNNLFVMQFTLQLWFIVSQEILIYKQNKQQKFVSLFTRIHAHTPSHIQNNACICMRLYLQTLKYIKKSYLFLSQQYLNKFVETGSNLLITIFMTNALSKSSLLILTEVHPRATAISTNIQGKTNIGVNHDSLFLFCSIIMTKTYKLQRFPARWFVKTLKEKVQSTTQWLFRNE